MANKDFDFENKQAEYGRIKRGFKDDFSQADLRRYQDPEGMSVAKLDLGLWYVENKEAMLVFIFFLVFLFGLVSWLFFFYQYGAYAIDGIRLSNEYTREIANRSLPAHSFYLDRAAKDLQLLPVQSIKGTANKRDIITQISNPNAEHWARFRYYFLSGDTKIGWEEGFVLPGEKKQLVLLGQDLPEQIGSLRLMIEDVRWARVNRHDFGDWDNFRDKHLDFRFSNISFSPSSESTLSEKLPINNLKFVMENRTSYNYWNVPLLISLYNYSDLAAVVSYQANDFLSGSSREISFTIPGAIKKISEVKITPDLDISRKDIYKDFKTETTIFR